MNEASKAKKVKLGDCGPQDESNSLSIGTISTGTLSADITGLAPNQTLNMTFPNAPAGGFANQLLAKGSDSDYHTK